MLRDAGPEQSIDSSPNHPKSLKAPTTWLMGFGHPESIFFLWQYS